MGRFVNRNNLILVAGLLFFWQTIINQVFPPGLFLNPPGFPQLHREYSVTVLCVIAGSGIALAVLWRRFVSHWKSVRGFLIVDSIVFGASTLVFAVVGESGLLWAVSYWTNAVSYGLLVSLLAVMWARIWEEAREGAAAPDYVVPLSMLLSVALAAVVAFVARRIGIHVMTIQIAFPLVSGFLLILATGRPILGPRLSPTSFVQGSALVRSPLFSVCCIIAFYLLISSMYWSVYTEGMSVFPSVMQGSSHVVLLFLLVCGFMVVCRREERERGGFFYAIIGFVAVCIGALYFVAVFWDTLATFCRAIVLPTRAFSIFLLWVLLDRLARQQRCPFEPLVAAVFLPSVCASWLVAYTFWDVWALLGRHAAPETVMLVLILASVFILTVATFKFIALYMQGKETSRESSRDSGEDADSTRKTLLKIKDSYGLTDREVDVLELLAEGHTKKRIAEILCISVSSVQTHAKSLYLKLDIHSRQEALDMVKGGAVSKDSSA